MPKMNIRKMVASKTIDGIYGANEAGPSFIAADCTIIDLDGTVLREGTNG